jgi:hypothetical protein
LNVIQRADTTPADRIGSYIQRLSECFSGLSIDDLFEGRRGHISYAGMKKTWAYGAVYFDYGGDPRCVTDRRFGFGMAEMFAKAACDSTKLGGRFNDVFALDVSFMLLDKPLDLLFKGSRFLRV